MKIHPHQRVIDLLTLVILLAGLLLPPSASAYAQNPTSVTILSADGTGFPAIQVDFEIFDASSSFVTNLTAQDVTLYEDDSPVRLNSLELVNLGVQFTVALNLGADLANRYNGLTRYEAVQQTLVAWAQSRPISSKDSFSLATNTGLQVIRSDHPVDWSEALSQLDPDLYASMPGLTALSRAVDLAGDAAPVEDMRRAILWVTPLIPSSDLTALSDLASRVKQQGTPVFIWLVASANSLSYSAEVFNALDALAAHSGGSLLLFTGQETLPDPDLYIDRLRYRYRAVFNSRLNYTATHQLRVEVQQGGASIASPNQPILLTIEPPKPIFLSPPASIERSLTEVEGEEKKLLPDLIALRILIEYPDGHPRDLQSTRLYVDDLLVVENTAEPFDQLEWDLSTIQTSGRHTLRVEVVDILGLSAASISMPVDVLVEGSTASAKDGFLSGVNGLVVAAIVLAGAVLLGVIALAGRQMINWNQTRFNRANRDPLTQPVIPRPDRRRKEALVPLTPASQERFTWPRQATAAFSSAPAWLIHIPGNGSIEASQNHLSTPSTVDNSIPLNRRDTTLGSDVQRVHFVVDHATVSGLHARISQTAEGNFQITDAGSVAGTWVNFAPVPEQGLLLIHGDLIQLGKISFRFELANPPQERQVIVAPYEVPR